jgi:hypothetical protein
MHSQADPTSLQAFQTQYLNMSLSHAIALREIIIRNQKLQRTVPGFSLLQCGM